MGFRLALDTGGTFTDVVAVDEASGIRYTTKTPITVADLLNDRVLPFFAEQGMSVIRMLTDRGTKYCGRPESHDYQLYLALNDIEHTETKVRHPQTKRIAKHGKQQNRQRQRGAHPEPPLH